MFTPRVSSYDIPTCSSQSLTAEIDDDDEAQAEAEAQEGEEPKKE